MLNRKLLFTALVVLSLVLFAPACKKKTAETEPVAPQPAPVEVAPEPAPVEVTEETFEEAEPEVVAVPLKTIAELNQEGVLSTVYFEFDQYDLSDSTRAVLQANAQWLQGNPEYRIVVEGHCDERGTIEYNLALGEKRARAVVDYLADLGLGASRVRMITYGEERPEDPTSSEAAWSKNRRAAFVIEQ